MYSMLLATPDWVKTLTKAVKNVLNPILIVACLVGIIYAIWVGITFARAEDSNARKEAKQKLITVIVGIVAAIALIILFYWLIWMIDNNKIKFWDDSWGENKELISPNAVITQVKCISTLFM